MISGVKLRHASFRRPSHDQKYPSCNTQSIVKVLMHFTHRFEPLACYWKITNISPMLSSSDFVNVSAGAT